MRANFIVLAYAIEAVKREKHSIVTPIKHKMTNIVGHLKGWQHWNSHIAIVGL